MWRSNRSTRNNQPQGSRTWVNPSLQANQERQNLNQSRRRICKNSPFWSLDFDLAQHRRDWAAGKEREARYKEMCALALLEHLNIAELSATASTSHNLPLPFDGKKFDTPHSNVLSRPTIFCPQWETGKAEDKHDIADWPSKSEMKYEGDDRIATDRLHGRFPGAPRMQGNETVNWQHKQIVEQWAFDDFLFPLPTEVDIWMRKHVIEELEFSEEEAREALGSEIMKLLDPEDQFLQ